MTLDTQMALETRLSGIEAILTQIQGSLAAPKVTREWYSVAEAASMLGKSSYTVRQWCLEGRINATKRSEKRGGAQLWNISAAEIERYVNEGSLTPDSYRNMPGSR
jgi:hypothetical protein